MKRDPELVRRILSALEDSERDPLHWHDFRFDGFSETQVSYHVRLLHEAELVHAKDLSSTSGFAWKAQALTWQGHEFLAASRDEGAWQKALAVLGTHAGAVPFAVITALLIDYGKKKVGL